MEENDDATWHRVLDINVVGMVRASTAALPLLRASEHAAIVNMCSIAALNGLPQRALYGASKGAVLALTFAMATDHIGEGIRVNCVSPGTVHTGFVDRMLERFPDPVAEKAALDARQATGRMVQPAEVAAAVAYLASPLSVSTAGVALDVDGGITHLRTRAGPEDHLKAPGDSTEHNNSATTYGGVHQDSCADVHMYDVIRITCSFGPCLPEPR